MVDALVYGKEYFEMLQRPVIEQLAGLTKTVYSLHHVVCELIDRLDKKEAKKNDRKHRTV